MSSYTPFSVSNVQKDTAYSFDNLNKNGQIYVYEPTLVDIAAIRPVDPQPQPAQQRPNMRRVRMEDLEKDGRITVNPSATLNPASIYRRMSVNGTVDQGKSGPPSGPTIVQGFIKAPAPNFGQMAVDPWDVAAGQEPTHWRPRDIYPSGNPPWLAHAASEAAQAAAAQRASIAKEEKAMAKTRRAKKRT